MNETKYTWVAVDNFGSNRVTVSAKDWTDQRNIAEKLVLLQQQSGSMSFQFSMRPEQARQFAMALIAAAESLA